MEGPTVINVTVMVDVVIVVVGGNRLGAVDVGRKITIHKTGSVNGSCVINTLSLCWLVKLTCLTCLNSSNRSRNLLETTCQKQTNYGQIL